MTTIKVRELIIIASWKGDLGWDYEQCLSNNIIEIDEIPVRMDWSWWDIINLGDDEDLKITVGYYDDDDMLIAEYSTWQSTQAEAREASNN